MGSSVDQYCLLPAPHLLSRQQWWMGVRGPEQQWKKVLLAGRGSPLAEQSPLPTPTTSLAWGGRQQGPGVELQVCALGDCLSCLYGHTDPGPPPRLLFAV